MNTPLLLALLNLGACAVIAFIGLFCVINNMTCSTNHKFRFGWVLLTTGACAVLTAPIFGHSHPTLPEVLIDVGLAIFLVSDRRRYCKTG